MNIFRQTELDPDESIQAKRLEESLESVLSGKQSGIDQREDPELSELISIGSTLRSASEESTDRPAFRSFHARSRAAILHRIGEMTEKPNTIEGRLILAVRSYFRQPANILTAMGSSVATVIAIVLVSGNVGGDGTASAAVNIVPVNNTSASVVAQQALISNEVSSQNSSRTDTNGSATRSLAETLDFSDSVPMQAIPPVVVMQDGGATVQAVDSEVSTYALPVIVLVEKIELLRSANEDGVVTVDLLRGVTDELARLGFEMRSNHPGAKYPHHVEEFQNAIVSAIVQLRAVDQSDKSIQGSLIAAKIVAEDTMHIATTYVYANQASR